MSIQAEELAQQLLTLPRDDRAQLARRLIASLETETEPSEKVEAAWREENFSMKWSRHYPRSLLIQ
tara:strand:+ start:28 stop:225 length:198 start_codon:yes stop_codon:yes gene_type:complete